jgi:hypothetical protein
MNEDFDSFIFIPHLLLYVKLENMFQVKSTHVLCLCWME